MQSKNCKKKKKTFRIRNIKMEYEHLQFVAITSGVVNLFLMIKVWIMHNREKQILQASEEMIAISEAFTSELQQLKNDTDVI